MLTRSFFLASLFAFSLPACGGQTELAADDASLDDDDAKADRTGGGSTGYFQIRPDLRKCASPYCGGDFVKRVNYSDIKCHDGKSASECYVASVDYSKTKLDESELRAVAEKSILVKGSIVAQNLNGKTFGKLVVTEVWAGATGAAASTDYAKLDGVVYRVKDNGVRCITYPCPSYKETKLNGTTSRNIAGVDFANTGASEDQISDAYAGLTSPDGLLLPGYNTPVTGPGGSSVQLSATNLFTKVEHQATTGSFCGGIAGIQCPAGQFCVVNIANACGGADLSGECRAEGIFCAEIYKPVCGCDGKTYGNDCTRQNAGVQLDHEGECAK